MSKIDTDCCHHDVFMSLFLFSRIFIEMLLCAQHHGMGGF